MPRPPVSLKSVRATRRDTPEPAPQPSRSPRYRHLWPGLLLLASLAVLLVALLGWGDQFLSPSPTGGVRRLLQAWPVQGGVVEAPDPVSVGVRAPSPPGPPPAPVGDAAALPGVSPSPASSEPPAVPGPPMISAPARGVVTDRAPAEALVSAPAPPTERSSVRYTVDLGAFLLSEEADLVEARLHQAGFSTVRFRQQVPASLFAVLIEPVRSTEEGVAMVERLKQGGFPDTMVQAAGPALSLRVGEPAPLGAAVRLASKLRAAGYEVRIAERPGRAAHITVRHGNFASRSEAEVVAREVARLGVSNEVVRVR